MEFIVIHYKSIIALIGSLTGILSLIYAIYGKHKDAVLKEKEFALKETQFESDKKLQITKAKRQQLFEKKIDAYSKLSICLFEYNKNLLNIGKQQIALNKDSQWTNDNIITEEQVVIESLLNIFDLVNVNYFYLSQEIISRYHIISKHYDESIRKIYTLSNLTDPDSYYKDKNEAYKSFFEQHKDAIIDFLVQIEKDIDMIKTLME